MLKARTAYDLIKEKVVRFARNAGQVGRFKRIFIFKKKISEKGGGVVVINCAASHASMRCSFSTWQKARRR